MKELNIIIGKNLKRIRKERGLSLDKVSELSGVSKGMLAQIERGEVNPTVNTLWKIANGLCVSFTTLIGEEKNLVTLVSKKEITPIIGEDGKYKAYLLFPFDQKRKFEVFTVELEPDCVHVSEAHQKGIKEYLTVFQGVLELVLENDVFEIKAGDAISFPADKKHIYKNKTDILTVAQVINFYP